MIRDFEDQDHQFLDDIAALWGGGFWSCEEVQKSLQAGSNFALVEEDDGLKRGFLLYSLVSEESELLYLFIPPLYRGVGLAKKLMKSYLSLASAKGASQFFLEVRQSNTPAINLYKAMGFQVISSREAYYKDGETAMIMTKDQRPCT